MSYSFTVRAPSKAAVKLALAAELDKAAAAQACHERDKARATCTANYYVDLLPDDESKDVQVTMSGSLTGRWEGSDVVLIESASLSVSAGLVTKA